MQGSNHVSLTTKISTWLYVKRSNTSSTIDSKLQQFKQATLNPEGDSSGSFRNPQWPAMSDSMKLVELNTERQSVT